jgi:hypothetical protein
VAPNVEGWTRQARKNQGRALTRRARRGARAGTLGALAVQSFESPSSMDVYMLRVTGGEARLHVDQYCFFRKNVAELRPYLPNAGTEATLNGGLVVAPTHDVGRDA